MGEFVRFPADLVVGEMICAFPQSVALDVLIGVLIAFFAMATERRVRLF